MIASTTNTHENITKLTLKHTPSSLDRRKTAETSTTELNNNTNQRERKQQQAKEN